MKSCIYVEYVDLDGQPIWGPFLAERLEWTNQLGSQGPGTMSHFTPITVPELTRGIVAPKRNDYYIKWTDDDGQTFQDVQGGFLWGTNLQTDDPIGPTFSGVDWTAWLDNPFPNDRTIAWQAIQDDPWILMGMWIGNPESSWDWWNNGAGVNQKVIIQDLIGATWDGPHAPIFSVIFTGSHWINVPGRVDGYAAGIPYSIEPRDTSPIRQHISNISSLNDPWIANFRCDPDKTIVFFFMKNKDPNHEIQPDLLANDENVIHHIDWTNNGPLATYVTGWGLGASARWYTTTHLESEEKFRRWRSDHMLGSRGQGYLSMDQIEEGTKAYADKFPQVDLNMTIYPDKLDPYNKFTGFQNLCGLVLDVDYDFAPFRRVDGIFYIISQHFHADEAGNWLCDLGLQQIYQD